MKNKTLIGLLIFIIAIIVCLSINPIKNVINQKNFENSIINTLKNNEYIDKLNLNGNYSLNLDINVNQKFNDLKFIEQEKIIKNITNELEPIWRLYRDNVEEIRFNYGEIKFYIDETNYYNTVFVSDTIYKNGSITEYSYNDFLKEQLEPRLKNIVKNIEDETIKDLYFKALNNITDTSIQEQLVNEPNDDIFKNELMYLYANSEFKNGMFKSALQIANNIEITYKDTPDLISKITLLDNLQGTYRANYINLIVIDKWKITFGVDPKYNTDNIFDEYSFNFSVDNHILKLDSELDIKHYGAGIFAEYKIDENKKTLTAIISNELPTYYYESAETTFPNKLKKPYIGMTKEQAKNSTWGEPNKINKTTTAYGIHEQWVYNDFKYLYFDNGYLTSIQE